MTTVDIAFELAAEALREVTKNLALTRGGAPAKTLVGHGEVAWDECCAGFAYVRLVRLFPADGVVDAADQRRCRTGLAADMELAVLRCAPMPTETLDAIAPPTAEEQTLAARVVAEDGIAMMATLGALAAAWADVRYLDVVLGSWTPLGPTGGCMGGVVPFTVELPSTARITAAGVA